MPRPSALRRAGPLVAGALAVATAAPLGAQRPPVRAPARVPVLTLTRPAAEFGEPFTQVGGVRELSDGRVIVADPRERTLQIVDFRRGEARPIGREGSGPTEWRMPQRVFPLPGDSTLVFDPGNLRSLVVAPDGTPAYTISPATPASPASPSAAGGGRGGMMVALRPPSGVDAAGRLYYQSPPVREGARGPEPVDSVALTRVDRRSGRTDTLAFLDVPRAQVSARAQGNDRMVLVRTAAPFAPRDEWAVAPDGRVAVVTHTPFRVTWYSRDGLPVLGPVLPYTPLPVTDADRAAATAARRDASRNGLRVTIGPGGTSVGTGGPAPREAVLPAEEPEWPATKPPFLANAAVVAPTGELWLQRTQPAGAAPLHDVYDASGRLVRQVRLPQGTALVGFGAGAVYLTRTDGDDLQWLGRYSIR